MNRMLAAWAVTLAMLCAARGAMAADAVPMEIAQVKTFMYQLQGIESPAAVDALANSSYDMLVIEPTATVKGSEKVDIEGIVAKLHAARPGRLVVAYLNVGQAESYRTYWTAEWKAPTKGGGGKAASGGTPDYILMPDPDGWSDNYNVAYWDARWQKLFATGADSEVGRAMVAGFDGVYLDWIDAYTETNVVAQAKAAHVDPAKAMVDFLLLIRKTARNINPKAVVIQQNAYGLIDDDPRVTTAIDGIGIEDTWFGGKANANWTSKAAGDIANKAKGEDSTAARLAQYRKFAKAGKAVFTIDYCVDETNAAKVYAEAGKAGVVPLVTRVSLDRITQTPPGK